jgi:hypothetical protein
MTNLNNTLDQIMHLHDDVADLDMRTLMTVLPSWGAIVNNSCINQAMRFIPEHNGDAEGIEGYSAYEIARRALIREAEESILPALISLQRMVWGWMVDADLPKTITTESTLMYLNNSVNWRSQVPSSKKFEDEWDLRKKLMPDFAISKEAFVAYEMDRAMNNYNKLVAKGDDAVRLIDTISLDVKSDDLPEYLPEAFETKMLDKLQTRWGILEMDRCNVRTDKSKRDEAKANQLMIAAVLQKYGETPSF